VKYGKALALTILVILLLSLFVLGAPKVSGCTTVVPADIFANTSVDVTGAVLALRMDEGFGNTVYDSSGNENDGAIYGATWVNGTRGQALSFDGTNSSYVQVPDSESLDNLTAITISVVFKLNEINKGQMLFSKCTDLLNHIELYVEDNNHIGFNVGLGIGLFDITAETTLVNAGVWYDLVATYETSDSVSHMRLYLDGAKIGETQARAAYTIHSGTNDQFIGKTNSDGGAMFFSGAIDEFHIYNCALSATEISNEYNSCGKTSYTNFASTQIFTTIYHENASNATYGDFWFFDNYGIQVQNCNVTVNTWFSNNILNLTLNGYPGTTGNVNLYVGVLGSSVAVAGASVWNYSDTDRVVKVAVINPNDTVVLLGCLNINLDATTLALSCPSPTSPETGQTFGLSGKLLFDDTTAAPDSNSNVTIHVSQDGTVVNSTTTFATDGSFQCLVTAPLHEGTYTYLIYATTPTTGSPTNQTLNVFVNSSNSEGRKHNSYSRGFAENDLRLS
jgi:hypothetical protein